MAVNYGNKTDRRNKIKKTKYSDCDEFIYDVEVTLKRFGFIKHSSGLYDGENILFLRYFNKNILHCSSNNFFLYHKVLMKA